jgi:WD40 repeat protein
VTQRTVIGIWDANTGEYAVVSEPHGDDVVLAALADGRLVFSSSDKVVRIWDPEDRRVTALAFVEAIPRSLLYSPSNTSAANAERCFMRGRHLCGPILKTSFEIREAMSCETEIAVW